MTTRRPSETAIRRPRWAGALLAGLLGSLLLLALAPLFVADTYSIIQNTLSESGGQGVEGAWVQRAGVVLAAATVFVMTSVAGSAWPRPAVAWLRAYVLALMMLVAFPEAPWDGGAHDETVAILHTAAAVCGAVSFIAGVVTISLSRPSGQLARRLLDWLVVLSIAVIPQIMLMTSIPGLWQRVMVAIGYGWLFAELGRIGAPVQSRRNADLGDQNSPALGS